MGKPSARPVVVDAGPLIAFDRGDENMRIMVRRAIERRGSLVIPSGVLAQVWRDGSRQAQLATLVRGATTHVEPLDEPMAKAAGALCGRAGSSDVIDATVVLTARRHRAVVVTSDPDDLRRLDPHVEVAVV